MSVDLSRKVSWVTSARKTATTDVTLASVVDQIRGGAFKSKIDAIRSAVANGEGEHAKQLKLNLPAILFSGLFSHRSTDGLIQHAGLLVADFDDLGPKLRSVRERLIPSPHLLLLFVSPSGTGLKAVFRVSPDPAAHGASFQAVEDHVLELTSEKIDPSGKDVCRLCFVSYDPELYVSPTEPETLLPRASSPSGLIETPDVTPTLRNAETPDTPTFLSLISSPDFTWIAKHVPTATHQTNKLFFTIARHLLAKEQELGRRYTPIEMKALFDHWHASCPPEFLTGTQEDYFDEFCRICAYAKTPLGDSNLDRAWKQACEGPFPAEASLVSDERKRLVALCARLQEASGTEPFFLSCRQVAGLFGIEPITAQRWLKQLEGLRVLRCVQKGDIKSHKASEFRYMDSTPFSARS